ncbi:MAG: hypothetical protein KTR18_01405 [Acidiferrobacterales bacterium]|nr:hypothetical protein [Acidiferrobacterales bacterium]
MSTEFIKLNDNWNADPNAAGESVAITEDCVELSFFVNAWAYEGFHEEERIALRFYGCTRYHLEGTNDEGWYSGQCRFSKLAPEWGEFYQVKGDLKLNECSSDWIEVTQGQGENHYLFYLGDNTFECDATSFELVNLGISKPE